jgi:hypothetical protein
MQPLGPPRAVLPPRTNTDDPGTLLKSDSPWRTVTENINRYADAQRFHFLELALVSSQLSSRTSPKLTM